MAVRLNMSLASLCSHIHTKSLTMSVSPKHIGQRNHLLPSSDCTYSHSPAGGAAAH